MNKIRSLLKITLKSGFRLISGPPGRSIAYPKFYDIDDFFTYSKILSHNNFRSANIAPKFKGFFSDKVYFAQFMTHPNQNFQIKEPSSAKGFV